MANRSVRARKHKMHLFPFYQLPHGEPLTPANFTLESREDSGGYHKRSERRRKSKERERVRETETEIDRDREMRKQRQ
jgi:hypothetical protein